MQYHKRCSCLERDMPCGGLGADDKLSGQQTLRLVLRDVCAVDDVGDELGTEGQRHVVAVDGARAVFVDEKQIIAVRLVDAAIRVFEQPVGLRLNSDVGVLADLDVTISPEDEEAPIAPGTEAV